MIIHDPLFDTAAVEKIYTEKDGVPVKYVCTSALGSQTFSTDVYYRETPHPEFGNRYFAIYRNIFAEDAQIRITNADLIEDLDFAMIEDDNGDLWYSSHRHDYVKLDNGKAIDGGRSYIHTNTGEIRYFNVKDGEFVERFNEESEGYYYPGGDVQI